MSTRAMFPQARARAGMYESFYLRAVSPQAPVGVWIRHTVQKPRGAEPRASVWCTVFDAAAGAPFMHKLTSDALREPPGGWIEIGERRADGEQADDGQGAKMGPEGAEGACGPAGWSLRTRPLAPELRHLPRELLYRAPLPRTKLTSPAPAASFDGRLRIADRRELTLEGWPGMVGHNWGAEHAERWIWLHGIAFAEDPDAWLDVALGRILIAGRLTPWVANGALWIEGRRLRLGGLGARGLRVQESAAGAAVALPAEHGAVVQVRATVPPGTAAGWRYGDPDDAREHDVVNCSIAALELSVRLPGDGGTRTLSSAHGGVYELGMRERDHGVAIAPFED